MSCYQKTYWSLSSPSHALASEAELSCSVPIVTEVSHKGNVCMKILQPTAMAITALALTTSSEAAQQVGSTGQGHMAAFLTGETSDTWQDISGSLAGREWQRGADWLHCLISESDGVTHLKQQQKGLKQRSEKPLCTPITFPKLSQSLHPSLISRKQQQETTCFQEQEVGNRYVLRYRQ